MYSSYDIISPSAVYTDIYIDRARAKLMYIFHGQCHLAMSVQHARTFHSIDIFFTHKTHLFSLQQRAFPDHKRAVIFFQNLMRMLGRLDIFFIPIQLLER